MDQIARRAAVNKQLLFYYFHSKRGLFTAVLARGAAELEQALADLPTGGERPLDRIRLALDAQFDFRRRIQTSSLCSHKPAGPRRGRLLQRSSGWSCSSPRGRAGVRYATTSTRTWPRRKRSC